MGVWAENGACSNTDTPTATGTPPTNPGDANNCAGIGAWGSGVTVSHTVIQVTAKN